MGQRSGAVGAMDLGEAFLAQLSEWREEAHAEVTVLLDGAPSFEDESPGDREKRWLRVEHLFGQLAGYDDCRKLLEALASGRALPEPTHALRARYRREAELRGSGEEPDRGRS